MNEKTIIDNVVSNEKSQNESSKKVENQSTQSNKVENPASFKKGKKDNATSKIIGASAAAAAAGFAVGVITPLQVFPQALEIDEDMDTTLTDEISVDESMIIYTNPTAENSIDEYLEVATSVDDSMSFNEAFAAARQEIGAGGLFIWQGHTYGTYYADEWNAMSAEEREEYWANVHQTTSHINEEINSVEESIELEDVLVDEIPAEPQGGWDNEYNDDVSETEAQIVAEEIPVEPQEGWNMEDAEADIESVEDAIADALLDAMFDSVEEGNILFDDTISEDLLEENFDDGGVTENPDIDLLASNYTDPYIPIDNDMDMSEFA